ncbi:MAG: hypothetical protein HC930_07950 [Hydrococcus sp. SU_1_0]|nr:hypothetical protein [Hydrococcus sp. SU_1_0]
MALKIPSFWQETPELNNILEIGEWTATTTSAGLGLAITLGVAANPALGIAAAGLAFASPLKKVIEVAASRKDKKLTLEEVVVIAAPLAYLKSFNYWIESNSILREKINQKPDHVNKEANIRNFTLDHNLAVNALGSFYTSELGQHFNQILSSYLKKSLNWMIEKLRLRLRGWHGKLEVT